MTQATFQGDIFSRIIRAEQVQTYENAREDVRIHLENLLNALQGRDDLPSHFREVTQSLATYGLHGFNSANLESHSERHKIMNSIKKAIQLFEPRLEHVEIEDHGIIHPFILTFQIRGSIRFDDQRDYVAFGTTINKYGNTVLKN